MHTPALRVSAGLEHEVHPVANESLQVAQVG